MKQESEIQRDHRLLVARIVLKLKMVSHNDLVKVDELLSAQKRIARAAQLRRDVANSARTARLGKVREARKLLTPRRRGRKAAA